MSSEGLAHYLEHAAFLGSRRYPRQGNFSSLDLGFDHFLTSFGGSTNAATFKDRIVFATMVRHPALEEAIDRMLDMVMQPELNRALVEGELHAVESEHIRNKKDEGHRLWATALRRFRYPLSRFPTGDSETLRRLPREAGIDVISHLESFVATYMCPENLFLFVNSAMSINDMQQAVEKVLSADWIQNIECRGLPTKNKLQSCTSSDDPVECSISVLEPRKPVAVMMNRLDSDSTVMSFIHFLAPHRLPLEFQEFLDQMIDGKESSSLRTQLLASHNVLPGFSGSLTVMPVSDLAIFQIGFQSPSSSNPNEVLLSIKSYFSQIASALRHDKFRESFLEALHSRLDLEEQMESPLMITDSKRISGWRFNSFQFKI
eukprot:Gregarina_sp_Poly_1__5286@NODE_279_length_10190_cov_93_504495_g243_i0_p4_GENE_NODE_279_length_10190_cov_93_504495_g243_i0NODE_279_length_10190_cov_93_504495_g243_i0_p4_ORF_typecomplete_len374_score47_86Peptidase_M16/PF00675_20/5_8e18Peptidase_M16_C/PF05193_21/0_0039_NODE_279_length_10190_cov_93_504495_g243_i086879808